MIKQKRNTWYTHKQRNNTCPIWRPNKQYMPEGPMQTIWTWLYLISIPEPNNLQLGHSWLLNLRAIPVGSWLLCSTSSNPTKHVYLCMCSFICLFVYMFICLHLLVDLCTACFYPNLVETFPSSPLPPQKKTEQWDSFDLCLFCLCVWGRRVDNEFSQWL